MPRTLKLTIAYDGTNYAGWQRQATRIGIQQVLEEEIDAIVGAHNPLNAAGRTDPACMRRRKWPASRSITRSRATNCCAR
jgi:tRNA pseudouridine38-40 synthase